MLGGSLAITLGARGSTLPTFYSARLDETAPRGHWRFDEDGGSQAADRIGGNHGTYQSPETIEFGIDPLVQDSDGGRSIALSGAGNPPHVTIDDLVTTANFTLDLAFQPDRHKAKHVLITTGGGSIDGEVSLEVEDDGAGGLRLRQWTVIGGSASVWTSPNGAVPLGAACKITYVQENGVGRRLYVDGVLVGSRTLETAFSPPPAGTWYIGTWPTGSDALDGLIGELASWDSALTPEQVGGLAVPQSVLWLADWSESVEENSAGSIDPAPYAHPSTGITAVVVSDGALVDLTADGGVFDWTSGDAASPPTADGAAVRITKGGLISRTATISLTVTEVPLAGTFAARFPGTTSPPAGASVWVAPGGTAAYPGTQNAPMGSIADAIRAASPGDIIAVRANQGAYTGASERNQTFTGLDFSAHPIQVIGYGSTTRRAQIDLSIQKFRGGTPASPTGAWTQVDAGKDIWEETAASNPDAADGMHGFFFGENGEKLRLAAYASQTAFDTTVTSGGATEERYCGPGLWSQAGAIRIRTETGVQSVETGHGAVPLDKNPNNQDIIVFGDDSIYTFNDCKGIHFRYLEFQHGNKAVEFEDSCDDITFTDCVFSGRLEYISCNMQGATGNAQNIAWHYCDIGRFLPRYFAYYDWKSSPDSLAGLNGRADMRIDGADDGSFYPQNFRWENCAFIGTQQALWAGKRTDGLKILHCDFIGERDDVVSLSAGASNFEFAYNYVFSYGLGMGRIDGGASSLQLSTGTIYIHHNIFDLSRPVLKFPDGTYANNRWLLGHGVTMSGLANPFTMKIYHNTFIQRADEDGAGGGPEYRQGWTHGNTLDVAQEFYNNICVQLDDWQHIRDCAANVCFAADGNVYHRASGSSQEFTDILDDNGNNWNFGDLAALKGNGSFIAQTQELYAPGMEASGAAEDPSFVGGSSFPLSSPADYRPQSPAATSAGVDLTGKGWPGPQDTAQEAWRGALDPNGDGSEIGVT